MIDCQGLRHEHMLDCLFGACLNRVAALFGASLAGVRFSPTLKNGEMCWHHSS